MFNFELNNDEANIINEIATLFLEGISENNIKIEETSINRLVKFTFLDPGDSEFSIIDFYSILVYLTWAMRNVSIRYTGKFDVNDDNSTIIKKLRAKINYLLNNKLKSEFIYFDYEDYIETIHNNQQKVIIDKLGTNYEKIKLYPPVYKKFKEENCKVKYVLCREDKAILVPEYGQYFVYQEKI